MADVAMLLVLGLATASPTEPPALLSAAKSTPAATQAAALAHPDLKFCSGKLGATGDIDTLPCRLAVAAADDVKDPTAARVSIDMALGAAAWVSAYTPQVPSPGLRQTRLSSHRAACGIVFRQLSALEAIGADAPEHAAAVAALTATPPLRTQACDCAKRTAALAVGANAGPAEQAEIQGILTTERCFMAARELHTAAPKGPESLSQASGDAQAVASASSPAGRLVALASGRAVEFSRCANKGMKGGVIIDGDKLSRCACNVAKRWALPFRKDDPSVSADVPLAPGAVLPLTVEGGQITTCGPAKASQ